MEYFVYIIQSKSTKKFYTGITNNFDRRLSEHNQTNSNTLFTKYLHDFEPIFVQVVNNRLEARVLEKYLKSGRGREFRAEIVKYKR